MKTIKLGNYQNTEEEFKMRHEAMRLRITIMKESNADDEGTEITLVESN